MKENKVDTKEFEIPETMFVRDIENKVFQSIILQSLGKIKGIGLLEGNFVDTLLGREVDKGIKGIYVEQDSKSQTVKIRIEINVAYGIAIPQKAEEIQGRLVQEVSQFTGLHVAAVHVIFKGLITVPAKSESVYQVLNSIEENYTQSQIL